MSRNKVPGTFSAAGPCADGQRRFPAPCVLAAAAVLIVATAAVLRLAQLDNRLMHCDEANQAGKLAVVLQQGRYNYDPQEHHGPTLSFFAVPVARLSAAEDLTGMTEIQLRLVPALFGALLVGMAWLLRRELGTAAVLWAALLSALSPAMVFYSRYFIQEMLLVCFTFGAIVAAIKLSGALSAPQSSGRPAKRFLAPFLWSIVLGCCIGMMHATKETCVIALGAMAAAAASTALIKMMARGKRGTVTYLSEDPSSDSRETGPSAARLCGILLRLTAWGSVALVIAVGVSALFYSSFFDNAEDVGQSYTAYSHYFHRAAGEGSAGPQDRPWYDYFQRLFWWQHGDGPRYSEAIIGLLALVGLVATARGTFAELFGAERGKGPPPTGLSTAQFLAVYTVAIAVVYSAVPYKTPWCALGMLHGMILLAGIGAAAAIRAMPHAALRVVVVLLILAGAGQLGWQAHRASFVTFADPNNPYVHTETSGDVMRLARRIEKIASVHPHGLKMHVQVIHSEGDYWPLPWYLRDFSRVGYFDKVPRGSMPGAVIIMEPRLERPVVEYVMNDPPPGQRPMYQRLPQSEQAVDWQLRPHVPLRVLVQRDLLVGQGSP
ncbi:MAG: TIGR03663 family protein [Candidatus Nealsonbacteria bacterium]|nr:TIGR03663 family protein [Candidatus Nealsonbacteria bacterium]